MSDQRIEALQAELSEKVAQLRTSEEWLDAMAAAASFHQYSFHNWMLMWAQGEQRGMQVTRPAGYRAWQGMNRYVRKGEKALKILAPMMQKIDDGNEVRMVLSGFRVVNVFDISQTDGEPLPLDVMKPPLLEGEGDLTLRMACEEMIVDQGFTMSWAPLHGPNGTTNHKTKEVKIQDDLPQAQRCKTTVHELAHVLAHEGHGWGDCRGTIEVEAESIAYVVCKAAGLDTSDYSVSYVAGWAEETDDPTKAMMATAETVVKVARDILSYIEGRQAIAAQDAA